MLIETSDKEKYLKSIQKSEKMHYLERHNDKIDGWLFAWK